MPDPWPDPCPEGHWRALLPDLLEHCDPRLDSLRLLAQDRAGRATTDSGDPLHVLLTRLADALGRDMAFEAPGCGTRSFDERWLMALLQAAERGDGASYRFLLRARLAPDTASGIHFALTQARIWMDTRL